MTLLVIERGLTSRKLLTCHEEIRHRAAQDEADGIADLDAVEQPRRGDAESPWSWAHVARDVVVGHHEDVQFRSDRPHDALGVKFALHSGQVACPRPRQLPAQLLRLAPHPRVAADEPEGEGQVSRGGPPP